MWLRGVAVHHLRCGIVALLLLVPCLATVMASYIPENVFQRIKKDRTPWRPPQHTEGSSSKALMPSFSSRRILAGNTTAWNTLSGSEPLVIANGGSSGLFPDQTAPAYAFALVYSISNRALLCDLQLTKDGYGICRTGIDLSASTTINSTFPNLLNEYSVNGVPTTGFFSIDITASQALNNLTATQANPSRSPSYDGFFGILQPIDVVSQANGTADFWLNVEYSNFFSQHKLDMPSYVVGLLAQVPVGYISSPEIAFLKAVKTGAPKSTAKLILKFLGQNEIEPSTNVTYGSLLNNLKTVATYASGIMVPKEFIWPVDNNTLYLQQETKLVKEAHTAGLEIYASGFVNDPATPIYNYSFNPVQEYLQYVPSTGSIVDGFLTDFPTTASESLACFRGTSSKPSGLKTLVISHNGDSGDYPGCTLLAYQGAIQGGASHIDCPVQMTKDGVPICRESVDLLTNTDANTHTNLLSLISTIPQFQSTKGLFSINLTWAEIQTLKAIMVSPEASYGIERNQAYTGAVMSLSQFLGFALNTSSGIFIDIQNGYVLETDFGFDVVGAVLKALNAAGLNGSAKVVIQSEDSAVLQRFQQLTNYTLVYSVTEENIVVTKTQVAEVKALASYVTLPRGLVQVTNAGYLMNKTDIVDVFHAQNVTVLLSYLRNEFVTLPYDYESDPILEINTMIQNYNVDGLITDFPATSSSYLSNGCLSSNSQYSIQQVPPGELITNLPPSIPPPPPPASLTLNVTDGESALPPTFAPLGTPKPPSTAPSSNPSSSPSAAYKLDASNILVVIATALAIVSHFISE